MLIANVVFLILFTIMYAAAHKAAGDIKEADDRSENKLYFLYPMAALLLKRTGLKKVLLKRKREAESVCRAAFSGSHEAAAKTYWYRRVSIVLFILLLCNILSLFGGLSLLNSKGMLSEGRLIRPKHGEGSSRAVLEVEMSSYAENNDSIEPAENHGTNNDASKAGDFTAEISVTVNEREYTQEELASVMDRSVIYLEKAVLGENPSAERIEGRLRLISKIPGTGISVRWISEDPKLISSDGTINNEDADPEGSKALVKAIMSYGDTIREHVITFTIFPRAKSEKEKLIEELNSEIDKLSDKTSRDDKMKLPERLGKYLLEYKEKREDTSITITLMGIIAALFAWFMGDREHAARMKARSNQMLLDYPDIINKFTLLTNAGMTIKQAWIRISEDYLKKKSGKAVRRYAYEEMLVTTHELKLGINEAAAYEQFGKRTGVLPYMKLSTLIVQNLKKGNKGLVELLNREAIDAFEERKELAKRMGEEAQTKLLGPMLLMLVLVLAIIMIPALKAFNI